MKRKKLLWSLLYLTTIAFVSCNDEDDNIATMNSEDFVLETKLTSDEMKALYVHSQKSLKLTQDEAAQIALSAFECGDFNKSAEIRQIKNVESLCISDDKINKNLALDESDTIAYVFNFANNMGYAFVASDSRLEQPILAYSENGEFKLDTMDIGTMMFLDNVVSYLDKEKHFYNLQQDSLLISATQKILKSIGIDEYELDTSCIIANNKAAQLFDSKEYDAPSVYKVIKSRYPSYYGEWEDIINTQGPLVKVSWGQNAPYNALMPNSEDKLGCTSLAVSQLMTYWKYPNNFMCNGISINWNDIERNIVETSPYNIKLQIQSLCYLVSNWCQTRQTSKGGASRPIHALEALSDFGYKVPNDFIQYTETRVNEEMRMKRPIIAYGSNHKARNGKRWIKRLTMGIVSVTIPSHIWLIDGMLWQKRRAIYEQTIVLRAKNKKTGQYCTKTVKGKTQGEYQSRKYVHMNWGWRCEQNINSEDLKKRSNCWYLPGVFDCSESYSVNDKNVESKSINSEEEYYYIHIATGVQPK